ncbi:jg15384 [Pararge aegeria aegeria]|uniref:Jg15384 protein n=1 Tax=Pararge aegeria aegeria TaxID=348720 RepID=A0A8S4SC62_9NEOP|nr:jg15384 [Pararge aegeria aegeria]
MKLLSMFSYSRQPHPPLVKRSPGCVMQLGYRHTWHPTQATFPAFTEQASYRQFSCHRSVPNQMGSNTARTLVVARNRRMTSLRLESATARAACR